MSSAWNFEIVSEKFPATDDRIGSERNNGKWALGAQNLKVEENKRKNQKKFSFLVQNLKKFEKF